MKNGARYVIVITTIREFVRNDLITMDQEEGVVVTITEADIEEVTTRTEVVQITIEVVQTTTEEEIITTEEVIIITEEEVTKRCTHMQ